MAGDRSNGSQEATEIYLSCLFEDTNLAAIRVRRATVMPKDMHLVRKFREQRCHAYTTAKWKFIVEGPGCRSQSKAESWIRPKARLKEDCGSSITQYANDTAL
ncbi:hypothetical protein KIN20_012348 [Parelaphostrongylus tenuis]|uniref:Core Histone H2A/H2B/H3 domain-containing protein n=1 Tax=Parelaphostrongylus tenuis TaxID=148309 RepID=A0AAD5QK95_PARTN|nr:hypothetical protein KIN20_012348 [Parelaphostrongylus tenuis]